VAKDRGPTWSDRKEANQTLSKQSHPVAARIALLRRRASWSVCSSRVGTTSCSDENSEESEDGRNGGKESYSDLASWRVACPS
jgi:hypothetical protein